MKITIEQSELLAALSSAHAALEKRNTMPILTHYLFDASGDGLTVRASNLERQVTAHASADVVEDGSVCLPKKIHDIVKALPRGATVMIDEIDGRATVRSGRGRYTLATLPAHEFPTMECSGEFAEIASLPDMLACVAPAMANQDVRYYLNGALLRSNGARMVAVATDGHRLHVIDAECGETFDVIVPRETVIAMISEKFTELRVGDRMIEARRGSVSIISRVLDGKFPDYEAVIPNSHAVSATVDAKEFCTAVSRAYLLANEKYRGVGLTPKNGVLAVTGKSDDGDAADEIDAECGEGPMCGFRFDYLLDAARAVRSERIELRIRDNSAMTIHGAPGITTVVMPLRM